MANSSHRRIALARLHYSTDIYAISAFNMIHRELLGLYIMVVSVMALNEALEKSGFRYKPRVCKTDDCKTMANIILSTMNRTIEPCDDFYEYACGAWTNSLDALPPDCSSWSHITMSNKMLSQKARTILESNNVNEISVERAKQWYRSCMGEEVLESRGLQPLTSIVTAVGGWPIAMALGQWNPFDYSWQDIELYYSRLTGSYAMYNVVIEDTSNNSSDQGIWIKAGKLPLATNVEVKRTFFDQEESTAYAKLITSVARAFADEQGARMSDEKIAREVDDMIAFEQTLATFEDRAHTIRDNVTLLQELIDDVVPNTKISRINLLKLVRNWAEGIGGISIAGKETIAVDCNYIIELGDLLNRTSFRTIVNYIHWHYISHMFHLTNSRMRQFLVEYLKETMGVREASPRWEQCVHQMPLIHALYYQFVLEYFTEDMHRVGLEMISNIKIELERRINGSSWLSQNMSKLWIEKLRNVEAIIGVSDWYKNITNLEIYYEELTVSDDYFNNVLNYMKFKAKKMIQALQDEDLRGWRFGPMEVNAFYMIDKNSLIAPAVDFQPPLFAPLVPDAVKYGILGFVLAHELSHGFDDTGSRFNKDGYIVEWSDDMSKSYNDRVSCFVNQNNDLMENKSLENILTSIITVGENIADTMGLEAAFDAYKATVRKSVKGDLKLPGLENFNNDQLFLLSYATLWCETSTPQVRRKRILSNDPHGSPRLRTLQAMSNIEGFANAFNCSKGSPMNPINKCSMWT